MTLNDIQTQAMQLPLADRRRLAQLLPESITTETSGSDASAVTGSAGLSPWLQSLVGVISTANDDDDYVTYLQSKYQ